MIQFSATLVEGFRKALDWMPEHERKHLRVGQAFFNYFNCHKVQGQDRALLDRLYEQDGDKAWATILNMTDYTQ